MISVVIDEQRERIRKRLRTRARRRFFSKAAALTPLISVEADRILFLAPTWDTGVGRRLFVSERRREIRLLARVVAILEAEGMPAADGVFVDVGANIGTTTLPALVTHRFRHAVAIEPEPSNARILRAAAALNGVQDRLTVLQAAADELERPATLKLHGRNSGGHRLLPPTHPPARVGGGVLPVRAAPLELLLAEANVATQDIGLLWIDAQGSEQAIMRAAPSLVGTVPAVLEIRPSRWSTLDMLIAAYDAAIDLRSGETIDAEPPRAQTDLLLLSARRESQQAKPAERMVAP